MLDKKKVMKWIRESEENFLSVPMKTVPRENAIRGGLAVLAVLRTSIERGQFDFVVETEVPPIEKPPDLPEMHEEKPIVVEAVKEPEKAPGPEREKPVFFGAIS